MVIVAAAAIAMFCLTADTTTLSGEIPALLHGPVRAVWVDSSGRPAGECDVNGLKWTCVVPAPPRGLVVLAGSDRLAFEQPSAPDSTAGFQSRRWGSAIVVQPGGAALEDLQQIRVTASMPERSVNRPNTLRFQPVLQPDVAVLKLSDTVFWIAGDEIDADAYLTVEAPLLASMRVSLATVVGTPPEQVVEVLAAAPFTLSGRVQTQHGEDVEGAAVELYEPLVQRSPPGTAAADALSTRDGSLIRIAETRTGSGGLFAFEHRTGGPFLVSVVAGEFGRGSARVNSVAEPVVVRLSAPPAASGRVLRHQLPVAGATIRFVPDPDAFRNSTDPEALAAEAQTSGNDGRFRISLPPLLSGTLLITGPDRAVARLAMSSPGKDGEILLGDVSLPDPVTLAVRLLDPSPCELSAAGPVGSLGLSIVKAAATSNVHYFELPEAGEWLLNASCSGRSLPLQPQVVVVPPAGREPPRLVDVQIVR
jgi:hypothetical protein